MPLETQAQPCMYHHVGLLYMFPPSLLRHEEISIMRGGIPPWPICGISRPVYTTIIPSASPRKQTRRERGTRGAHERGGTREPKAHANTHKHTHPGERGGPRGQREPPQAARFALLASSVSKFTPDQPWGPTRLQSHEGIKKETPWAYVYAS